MQNSDEPWQYLKPRERMEYLLKTGHLSDCSFIVRDEYGEKNVLKCHKFVLMTISPVFERMFEGNFAESRQPDNIVLDDVSAPDFEKFIQYLYWHDNKKLDYYDLGLLQTLIYLSKKFMVFFLANNCLNAIKTRLSNGLNPDLTIDLYQYAHEIEDADLIGIITNKLRNNSLLFKDNVAIFDLNSEIFIKFIVELKVDDKVRFNIIDRYCNIRGLVKNIEFSISKKAAQDPLADIPNVEQLDQESHEVAKKPKKNNVEQNGGDFKEQATEEKTKEEQQKNKEYIDKLLNLINFTSMSPYDFCAGPGVSTLLTTEKKFELLAAICISEHKMSLLSTCSFNYALNSLFS